jgi:cystathionine beta-lyase
MTTDFDSIIPRNGTDCIKWDFGHGDGHGDGDMVPWDHTRADRGDAQLLPMSLADMEFRCPEPVIAALMERARHGIFSYSLAGESFYEAVIEWIERRHHWPVERDWIVAANGVVPTLSLLVREMTAPTDAVIIQQPVFGPFARAVETNGRRLISNDLIEYDRAYTMDFDDLAAKAADPAAKMLILCNPHNPIGKVWGKADLKRLGEICLSHGVLVIADELHCDLLFDGVSFTPFASLGTDFAANSVTCMAASKSFSLAGLHLSATIIPDADRRAAFKAAQRAAGTFDDNLFGLVATEAAFRHGEPWLAGVMAYIQDNYRFLADHLAQHTPEITVTPAEATYLMWLDCRRLGVDDAALDRLMLDDARLIVGSGTDFGDTGSGFVRLNIACPRAQLAEALDRLVDAVAKIRPSLA